ncbi:MAG: mitochondrial Homoaconitase [Geoglossum umbratile]|nr:MAG: mitochondrial Homoaconitase [Geoglossum umbratile]
MLLSRSGGFGNIFSRNSINEYALGYRRWTLMWDVARSVKVQEGKNGDHWEEKVGKFAENLQEIVAKGGLENWIKHEIVKAEA